MWYSGSNGRNKSHWNKLPLEIQRRLREGAASFRYLPQELQHTILGQVSDQDVARARLADARLYKSSAKDVEPFLSRLARLLPVLSTKPPEDSQISISHNLSAYRDAQGLEMSSYGYGLQPGIGYRIQYLRDDVFQVQFAGRLSRQSMSEADILRYMAAPAVRAVIVGQPLSIGFGTYPGYTVVYAPPMYEFPDANAGLL